MTTALATRGLGKRYGRTWALRDCTLEIPAGRVAALVGPNGAGKTTLLQLAVGLLRPSEGVVEVGGVSPTREAAAALARVGFVAQEHPLYRGYTVDETLIMGRHLNARWDQGRAERYLQHLGIPLRQRVGKLSGGQRAQLALAMALAKRAEVLLLDEPAASLDPLARRDFLGALMEATAAEGLTVVLSSHILADVERVCDYAILLVGGRVRLAGDTAAILAQHRRLSGPADRVEALASRHHLISVQQGGRQASVVAQLEGPLFDPAWEAHELSLEDLVLAYLEQGRASGVDDDGALTASQATVESAEVVEIAEPVREVER